jgi:Prokaryotic cytochrome b561.
MKRGSFLALFQAGAACLAFLLPAPALADAAKLDNAGCLECHDSSKKKIEVPGKDDEKRALAHINAGKFGKGIHADMQCVACHKEITDSKANHAKARGIKPANCVDCHQALWETARQEKGADEKSRLGLVVRNIEAYKSSFHAKPDKDDPSRPMATCEDCHNSHEFNVPPKGSERRTAWHKGIPDTCGAKCHEDQLEAYAASIHGEELLDKGNMKSAVCTDCHTSHNIAGTASETFKLANVNACGSCHEKELQSFADTYHGQVNRLGYAYAAKCADCHESHKILPADHPKSTINPKNRLKTCTKCHSDKKPGMRDATPGFVTFGPHANTHDFEKYPQMYIASKFMVGLLIFVFAFFWAHSGLWYYREWQDRKAGKPHARIDTRGMNLDENRQHFRRFHWGWRLGHLVFALVTMTLVLTGTTALYAESAWAPVVAKALGGPKMLGLIHRICAALFVGIFLIHFVYVMQKLLRDRSFRWFGPDSLIPNWKDFADCWGMFKWFVDRGPKPLFDRWAYFEKFDYWAVFWGGEHHRLERSDAGLPARDGHLPAGLDLQRRHPGAWRGSLPGGGVPLHRAFLQQPLPPGQAAAARRGDVHRHPVPARVPPRPPGALPAHGRFRRAVEVPGRGALAGDDPRLQDPRPGAHRRRSGPAGAGGDRVLQRVKGLERVKGLASAAPTALNIAARC